MKRESSENKRSLGMKIMRSLFLLAGCTPLLMYPLQHASALGLKENSMITDNTIKLGDIFYGLQRDEDRVLGIAPRPGEDMVLNAKTLLRIALALDIPWRPANATDQVILRRAATIIEREAIEDNLMQSLIDQGIYGDFNVNIPSQYSQITLPADQPAEMEVVDMTVDNSNKSFKAVVAAPSAANPIQRFEISGTIQPMVSVPVVKENIQTGRIINASDIEFVQIKESDFTSDTIADAQSLIGMTSRRLILAGHPVKESETIAPKIIARGDVVTLNLQQGVLSLSIQAKALENGAKGDLIRVVNTTSNQTLQAEVTGEKEVRILSN